MNWSWLSFVAGVLVGWLLEWLIDYIFWRRKRRDQLAVVADLQQQLEQGEDRQRELEKQAGECAQALEACRTELDECQAAAQGAAQEMDTRAAGVAMPLELDEQEQDAGEAEAAVDEAEAAADETEAAVDEAEAAADEAEAAADEAMADATEAEVAEKQDLTRIEGIGPKTQGLLNDAGIVNYAQLAGTPVERLQEILDAAGSRYRLIKPETWPRQARLAAENKWDDLQTYQDDLKGGRVEKENLTKIEGIGPKIAGLLQDAGISNFSLLADASVERLREVLTAAGSRYRMANPTTWPRQARLAAEDKWDELQALQDRFSGGREVDESEGE